MDDRFIVGANYISTKHGMVIHICNIEHQRRLRPAIANMTSKAFPPVIQDYEENILIHYQVINREYEHVGTYGKWQIQTAFDYHLTDFVEYNDTTKVLYGKE